MQKQIHANSATNRRQFVKNSCRATCLVLGFSGTLQALSSCAGSKYFASARVGNTLEIPLAAMVNVDGKLKRYLVLEHDSIIFPVVLFATQGMYSAFILKCSHQGNELQAAGEYLVCTAHGSEFDSGGQVKRGPATQNLAPLPVQAKNGIISIIL